MFPLLRYFSITSLFSVLVTTLCLGLLHYHYERNRLLVIGESNHLVLTQAFANALLPQFRHLAHTSRDLDVDALRRHPEIARLDQSVRDAVHGTQVVKVKFYELNGRTLFSTDAMQIGKNYSRNPGLISASQGRIMSELTHRGKFSAFDREIENRDVLSSYVALRRTEGAPIEGVLEIYSDVTNSIANINRQEVQVILSEIVVLSLLYGAIFFIVKRADGIIRGQYELQRRNEAELRVAATAFESQEGMIVTDANGVILRVNRAFIETTGYSAEEAVGQTPRILKSNRHDASFYTTMWESIKRTGSWRGEIWDRRKNGEVYPDWLSITAVKGDDGEVTHYVATQTDITQRKAAEAEIEHLAFFDALTGLPNRRLLLDRLQHAMTASARTQREKALLFVDLDNFKTLNDSLGHNVGDLLLQQVAERLALCVREGDTVSRLGGDEFVVMLEDLSENSREAAIQTEAVGKKILASLNQIYYLAGHEHHSSPSIGVTLFRGHRESVDEILKRADFAMYQAKASGRNTMCFFGSDMQAAAIARASMEADLRLGLQQNEFLLHYQAQVDGAGCLTGAEALVRWQQPRRGLIFPAEFIPLAEETGLILPLGLWVLETACTQLVAWADQTEMAHITLAVNISTRQFRQRGFVDQVLTMLDSTGANPHRLKLELTESLLQDDVEGVIAKMGALKAHGVGLSLDAFGTGYSSLAHLKRTPLDQLKIDRSFVRDMLSDPNAAAIVCTIITLAQSLGLGVIAHGVENEAQRNFLASHGCHAYQGYLFGRPGEGSCLR